MNFKNITKLIVSGEKIVIMTYGYPRSGKTTWCKKVQSEYGIPFIDYDNDADQNHDKMITLLIEKQPPIVLCDTFIGETDRKRLREVCKDRRWILCLVWLKTSVDECIKRNCHHIDPVKKQQVSNILIQLKQNPLYIEQIKNEINLYDYYIEID